MPNLDKRVIVVSHKNTLRCLLKQLAGLSCSDIKKIQVPNAQPIVVEFDEHSKYRQHYVLDDRDSSAARIDYAMHKQL